MSLSLHEPGELRQSFWVIVIARPIMSLSVMIYRRIAYRLIARGNPYAIRHKRYANGRDR